MTDSEFVFERGSKIDVGNAVDNGGFTAGSGSAQDVVAGAIGEVN